MATAQRGSINLKDAPSAKGMRFALVVSQWNSQVTSNLAQGARKTLLAMGARAQDVEEFAVPGSFELVHGCKVAAASLEFDAVIAIGSVIRGETAHFDYVCSGVSHGLATLNATGEIPVIFCVLTDDNLEQSLARCGGSMGNKGDEAAVAAVQMGQL